MEKLRLFIGGIVLRDAFEGVPQNGVAATDLVDGKVGFEHATVRAEMFDGGVIIALRRVAEFLTGRRF